MKFIECSEYEEWNLVHTETTQNLCLILEKILAFVDNTPSEIVCMLILCKVKFSIYG